MGQIYLLTVSPCLLQAQLQGTGHSPSAVVARACHEEEEEGEGSHLFVFVGRDVGGGLRVSSIAFDGRREGEGRCTHFCPALAR